MIPHEPRHRRDFAKLIRHLASPQWDFDDATFNRSAASFDNPDHVSGVGHNRPQEAPRAFATAVVDVHAD